ncbi:MAG: class I SAM-dependent methyltransferase [Alphaproteobacteria bacterium]
MYIDVVDLRSFYGDRLGIIARRLITERLRRHWSSLDRSQSVLGIGYATPYLTAFAPRVERTLAFMPAAQGVVQWPGDGPNRAALVVEGDLPLPDSSVDRVLVIHSLEMVDNPGDQLREIWRVLTPAGRLLLVVPNRSGIWARSESTPFGYGRPFGRGQLTALLRETNFTPVAWSEVLAFPPFRYRPILRFGLTWERIGRLVWPAFSGVIIVEANKRVHDPVRVERRRLRPAFGTVLARPG